MTFSTIIDYRYYFTFGWPKLEGEKEFFSKLFLLCNLMEFEILKTTPFMEKSIHKHTFILAFELNLWFGATLATMCSFTNILIKVLLTKPFYCCNKLFILKNWPLKFFFSTLLLVKKLMVFKFNFFFLEFFLFVYIIFELLKISWVDLLFQGFIRCSHESTYKQQSFAQKKIK